MSRILIAEDEVNIASFIERGLVEYGHEAHVASDGEVAWDMLRKDTFQLLILDIIMPRMTGLELCAKFRAAYGYATPVIMLTALGTTDDVVKGLEAGADDYLVKPFSFRELEARIQALVRRAGTDRRQTVYGDLMLDPDGHRAIRNGKSIDLTIREYRLLEYFMANTGTTLSRPDIIRNVWEKEADRNMNIVDVYVNYLRAKIDRHFKIKLIQTVSGVGYRFGT